MSPLALEKRETNKKKQSRRKAIKAKQPDSFTVLAIHTAAVGATSGPDLKALTILLEAPTFFAVAAFAPLCDFGVLPRSVGRGGDLAAEEGVRVAVQGLLDGRLALDFKLWLVVAALAVAAPAVSLASKALAVQLEAFGFFAVARFMSLFDHSGLDDDFVCNQHKSKSTSKSKNKEKENLQLTNAINASFQRMHRPMTDGEPLELFRRGLLPLAEDRRTNALEFEEVFAVGGKALPFLVLAPPPFLSDLTPAEELRCSVLSEEERFLEALILEEAERGGSERGKGFRL